ncbi:Ceramide glucosyltransferase [Trinorchestia longiramus]|nr:Ceramide glucosyltransferase [Trinorchestia longiramus]
MVVLVWSLLSIFCDVLTIGILIYWVGIWCLHLIVIIYGCRKFRRRTAIPSFEDVAEKGEAVVGVTVLKPLVSKPTDPNLMTNLESYFNIAYPKYEVRFCIAEEGDPSIMVVKQLMSKYPNVEASIHVGAVDVGVNPKINNMYKGYQAARYPLLLMSDAGIFTKPEVLTEMVSCLTDDVGIVMQLPFTTDRKGWAASLEKVNFGGNMARFSLFLNLLDLLKLKANLCIGMSLLMRKHIFEHAGGIQAFSPYLAEDHFFAEYSQRFGWGVRMSAHPALQNHGVYSVNGHFSRLTRWTKLRLKIAPLCTVLELMTKCIFLGVTASAAAAVQFQTDCLAFFLFHMLAWILSDWMLLNIIQNGAPSFSKFEFAIAWLFHEFCVIFVHLKALRDPIVDWRTTRFLLHWGGRAEKIDLSASAPNNNTEKSTQPQASYPVKSDHSNSETTQKFPSGGNISAK